MSTIRLWSPLAPAEFAARLAEAIAPEPIFGGLGIGKVPGRLVVGSIGRSTLRLRRRADGINPSSQPRLVASFEPSGTGTCLSGEFGVGRRLWIFMAVVPTWLALGSYFMAPVVLAGPAANPAHVHEMAVWLPWIVLPPFLIGVGGLIAMLRHRVQEDRSFLIGFLHQTLDTQEVFSA